jgi:hypothetical protein
MLMSVDNIFPWKLVGRRQRQREDRADIVFLVEELT